jgi:hypothetical protein
MTFTYRQAMDLVRVEVPEHLVADLAVPILTGVQAQGDLIVFPHPAPTDIDWQQVPDDGAQLIRSEATGNTHWLHRDQGCDGVRWGRPVEDRLGWESIGDEHSLRVAYLVVPDGQAALLIHTDEHGANGIGPGEYAVNRKRESDPDAERRLLMD